MRRVVVQEFMSLDGVMQAPGGPEEDTSNGFPFGGWTAPYSGGGEQVREFMTKVLTPADLLLGRRTSEIFEAYWPDHADNWPGVMEVTKYVVSTTLSEARVKGSRWPNCVLLTSTADVAALKDSEGEELKVWGSSVLAQSLLARDLVDELVLMTHPVVLGTGKKLFSEGAVPRSFELRDGVVSSNGVVLARYVKAGDVRTGSVGD